MSTTLIAHHPTKRATNETIQPIIGNGAKVKVVMLKENQKVRLFAHVGWRFTDVYFEVWRADLQNWDTKGMITLTLPDMFLLVSEMSRVIYEHRRANKEKKQSKSSEPR